MKTRSTARIPVRRLFVAMIAVLALCTTAGSSCLAATTQAHTRPVPGDPLAGTGRVDRTRLTRADLLTGQSRAPVDSRAFAVPAQAAMPTHDFEGRLMLRGESTQGGFTELRDDYDYTTAATDGPQKHLPRINIALVQNGSHLIPTDTGLQYTGHAVWNLIVGPGRAWQEQGDDGWTRASLPFTLVERNQNCTHNGVLMFLFTDTRISRVRYQITQETCLYFKFNMWGQLAATYVPAEVPRAVQFKNAYAEQVAQRLPTKPISELATDFPHAGVDPSQFTSGLSDRHVTTYGLLIHGTHYVGKCSTRFGPYPYCAAMRLPSYSLAKSAFAGIALMRLTQRYGLQVPEQLIADYVPEHTDSPGDWPTVTFANALDMATGNYLSARYMADENGPIMARFLEAESYAQKIHVAFQFPHRSAAGGTWVYHSSDTFIVTRAMGNYLRQQTVPNADLFDMVRRQVFAPAHLSAGLSTLRAGNGPDGTPFGGYGLFVNRDDIAKIAKLLNNQNGAIGGRQLLDSDLLAASMQREPVDRGPSVAATGLRYNNGFWARKLTSRKPGGGACSYWVPFMSGYGGITVAMLPNGATYYYFSDNNEFAWGAAVEAAGLLAPQCQAGPT